MRNPLRLPSASRDHRSRLQRRSNHREEKDYRDRDRRLTREANDFAREKTKIYIRIRVDAARDGRGGETIGERLEIRCDLDWISIAGARWTDRERAETSGQRLGGIRFPESVCQTTPHYPPHAHPASCQLSRAPNALSRA